MSHIQFVHGQTYLVNSVDVAEASCDAEVGRDRAEGLVDIIDIFLRERVSEGDIRLMRVGTQTGCV
jgi:hypothetical protein